MPQYKIIIDREDLHQLFNQDQGMARLVEKVLNKVLEAEVAEKLQLDVQCFLRRNIYHKT